MVCLSLGLGLARDTPLRRTTPPKTREKPPAKPAMDAPIFSLPFLS